MAPQPGSPLFSFLVTFGPVLLAVAVIVGCSGLAAWLEWRRTERRRVERERRGFEVRVAGRDGGNEG